MSASNIDKLMLIYPNPNKNPYPQIHSRIHAIYHQLTIGG